MSLIKVEGLIGIKVCLRALGHSDTTTIGLQIPEGTK